MHFIMMGGDDSDREEIDLLIHKLTTARQRVPEKATPAADQPVASRQVEPPPVDTWTNARRLMPSMLTPSVWKGFAFGSAISLPHLPDLSRFFRLPGPVTMVRMWVGLGLVYSVSMTFWPYPKTYWLGLVLYLLSLALALVAGIWGARLSWDERLGSAQTIALGSVLWTIWLAAVETLPLI